MAQGGRPGPRARPVLAVVCLALAALLLTPAAVGYWAQDMVNDPVRYVQTVAPLARSPVVQDVITTAVTDALDKSVDIEAILTGIVGGVVTDPVRRQRVLEPILATIRATVDREVRALVASDRFAAAWDRLNASAQRNLLRLLAGDGSGPIAVQGQQLILDLEEVVRTVREQLVARGIPFPQKALTPKADTQLILVSAPRVAQLRSLYAYGNPIARWLLPLVGALLVVAFALAGSRARMLLAIGVALIANAGLGAALVWVGRQVFVDELAGTAFAPAGRILYDTLVADLGAGQQLMLILGLGLALSAVLTGRLAGRTRLTTARG